MALSIDAVSTKIETSEVTSTTFSHTNAGNMLYVGIVSNNVPTSVTYGGAAMTQVVKNEAIARKTSIYGIIDPASGANDIVITNASGLGRVKAYGISFINAKRAFNTGVSASGASTTATVDATSDTRSIVIDIAAGDYGTGTNTFTVGTSQTARLQSNDQYTQGYGSSEPGAATTTMSWTIANSCNWSICALNISPRLGGQVMIWGDL